MSDTEAIRQLRAFANDLLGMYPSWLLDDTAISAAAIRHGLIAHRAVTKSCGNGCICLGQKDKQSAFGKFCFQPTSVLTGGKQ